jgi:hypothetical protein
MAPPLAKDVGKTTKDLIEKEFPNTRADAPAFDLALEFKSKNAVGDGLLKIGSNLGDALTASVEQSFSYKPWNMGVKLTLESAGNYKSEVSVTDLGVKGLKVIGNHEAKSGDFKGSFEFKNDRFSANGSFDSKGEIPFSAVVQHNKLLAGVDLVATSGGALKKHDAFVNYADGDYNVTVRTADKFNTLSVGYLHNVNSDVVVAAQVGHGTNFSKIDPALVLVGSLKLDSSTAVKAKVGVKQGANVLGLALAQKLSDSAKVTVGASYGLNDKKQKFSVLLNLNN